MEVMNAIHVFRLVSQVPASLSPASFYSTGGQMSESVGPQMYHQSNLTMPDMGLAMGMKPEASPPTPRSLRLMPNTASGQGYGQSSDELRRVAVLPSSSGSFMGHESLQSQHSHQGSYTGQDRGSLGGLPVSGSTAAAMAAAKKKGIKSSLGRLFSKKEKVKRRRICRSKMLCIINNTRSIIICFSVSG